MKVCIYIDSKGMGGIETHVLQLIQGILENSPYDIDLLFWKNYSSQSHTHHPLLEKLNRIDPSIATRCHVIHAKGSLSTLFKYFYSNTAVVHSHGYKAGITARFIGLMTNTPIVSTYHNGDPGTGKLKFYNLIDKLTSFLSINIAVNEAISKPLKYCHVISNFVDAIAEDTFRKDIPSRKEIAFVGRLSHEKGPDIFLQLTQQSEQTLTHSLNYPISIYGDGPMMAELQQEYTHAEFKGMCDMEDYWKNIRVLVMPSRYEGLPLAALEAMARGIPVIASTAGALPKLINDCKIGKVITLNDTDLFKQEIELIMQQSDTDYCAQGNQLINFVDQYYSRNTNIPKILNQYQLAVDLK